MVTGHVSAVAVVMMRFPADERTPGVDRQLVGNLKGQGSQLPGAIENLERLIRVNAQSHRGLSRLGTLLALEARSPEELGPAVELLARSRAVNPEETGSLLLIGEIGLLRNELKTAEQRLSWACRTNPRAVGGFFLRAYLSWREGNT